MRTIRLALLLALLLCLAPLAARPAAATEETVPAPDATRKVVEKSFEALEHRLDALEKAVDDVLWFQRVGDVAFVDKLFIVGPPPARVKNPNATGAKNPVKFWTYVFVPRQLDRTKKHPLLLLPHGGVHANFTTYHTHIVREMVAQGYVVAAPEYRGSTGYGQDFFDRIDYGGLENEDLDATRAFMIENYEFVDGGRVGIAGWSHGGMMALMTAFHHPAAYKAIFAGVPVSDLIARMGYADDEYRQIFAAEGHLDGTPRDNIAEYRKRSPAWNVGKLQTPLLVHTNTNDDDVYVEEVELLIKALKAEGKTFEHEVFQDVPGGHSFDRIDTKTAREIRVKIYRFLAKYLTPDRPVTSLDELNRAGYR